MYPGTSMGTLCGLFGFSRQAWYDRKKMLSEHQMEEVFILKEAKVLREEHPKMGTRKLLHLMSDILIEHGIKMGRDKFYYILGEHGLLVKTRKKGARTTNSNHFFKKYPNLIMDLNLTKSGQLWVSDITYIRTSLGFVYLSLITDAYSKKIVGWCLWPDLTSEGPLNALKMAIEAENTLQGLMHHSDRGIQYCCNDYTTYLKHYNIGISMTEKGDPYENAIAERVNGILKMEYQLDETFKDYLAANEAVKKAVHKYNNVRPHSSCDYMTPVVAHNFTGEMKKRWKKKHRKASCDNSFEMQS